jgi:hypothetical protein
MSTLYWKNWIQLLLIIILFFLNLYDKVWKFNIKNIYPKYIKVYTDIDPTVDFIFPVNKIDRENSEKIVS